jgi:DNA-binding beta-propeller fold protein YncE
VSLENPGALAVMSNHGLTPRLVRTIPLPAATPAGVALTHDGRYLLVAAGAGAIVLDAARAAQDAPNPVLGMLSASVAGGRAARAGAIEVAISHDDRFAFVTLEYARRVAVFDLRAAAASRFRGGGLVGTAPVAPGPVSMAVSPDDRWLYVTTERTSPRAGPSPADGTITVIDMRRAETAPATAAVASAIAGCTPARVIVSADGGTVWMTARESDALLAFSAARLRDDPAGALLATVKVGEAPLGLALVDFGRRIVVADSNRFRARGRTSGLSVVDPAAALAGRPSLLGTIPAHQFPREMSVQAGGTGLLVTNFASDELEAVGLVSLP